MVGGEKKTVGEKREKKWKEDRITLKDLRKTGEKKWDHGCNQVFSLATNRLDE